MGGEHLELDATVDWLKAGGEMQLRVAHLKENIKSSFNDEAFCCSHTKILLY